MDGKGRAGRGLTADGALPLYHDYHPYLLLTGRPGVHGYHPHFGRYRLNSLGLRSPEIGEKRGPRVVVLGGSAVWGSGASADDRTLPAQMQSALDREAGLDAEVINAGVGAYFSFQELVLFAYRLIYLDVDLIVLFDGYNDIFYSSQIPVESYVPNEIALFDRVRRSLVSASGDGSRDWIRSIMRPVARLLRGKGGSRATTAHRVNIRGVRNYLTNTALLADCCRGRNIEIVLALQPYLPISGKRRTPAELVWESSEQAAPHKIQTFAAMYRSIREGLRVLAASRSVPFIDCTPAFDAVADTCFADHVHPNDLGYRILAERLAASVVQLLNARGRSS